MSVRARQLRGTLFSVAAVGFSIAGCSSAPKPPMLGLGLESNPPGADAVTSLGPGCKTPCTVTLPAPTGDFTVSYTLNDYQPTTVAVRVFGSQAGMLSPGTTRLEPDPVVAQLQPIAPPPKPVGRQKPKKPTAQTQ
jgi:hypothetical protein